MSDCYVESYFGHSGPVYRVVWTPGSSDTFASASADGTVCTWQVHQVRIHAALSGTILSLPGMLMSVLRGLDPRQQGDLCISLR